MDLLKEIFAVVGEINNNNNLSQKNIIDAMQKLSNIKETIEEKEEEDILLTLRRLSLENKCKLHEKIEKVTKMLKESARNGSYQCCIHTNVLDLDNEGVMSIKLMEHFRSMGLIVSKNNSLITFDWE